MDSTYVELQQALTQAKQEIEETYDKCKENKKFKHTTQARKDWYYQRLRERIQYKVYVKYRVTMFGVIERYINSVLPSVIKNQTNQFVDIKNVGLGDQV